MAREGQHVARVTVKGDTKSADRELAALAKREAELEKQLVATNRRLAEQDQKLNETGDSAEAAAARMQAATIARSQAQADAARRQQESLRATQRVTKTTVRQQVAAIERAKVARLQQLAVEQRFAATFAESSLIANRADEVRHQAFLQRHRVEQEARRAQKAAMDRRSAALTKAGGIATVAAVATDQLAKRSLALQNIQANLPFSIEKAREATKGLVSDFDLMQQAQIANRLGVAKSSEAFAEMAGTATTLSVAVGQDATQGLQDFTNGLGRGSTEVLDNLGITLRASEAHDAYAASIGKTTKELTDAQKRQAVVNLGLEKGAALAAKAKVQTDGFAGAWARASITVKNAADDVFNLGDNLEDLSNEINKSVGLTQEQAERATAASASSFKRMVFTVSTLGVGPAIADLVDSTEELADSTEELGEVVERGQPAFSAFSLWLSNTGTFAERTEKSVNQLALAFSNGVAAAEEARQAALIADQAESRAAQQRAVLKHRQEAQKQLRKLREEDRKERIANARAATDAELRINIQGAQRDLVIARQRLRDREGTTEQVLALIDTVRDAEVEAGLVQLQRARTRAEQLQAQMTIEQAQERARSSRLAAEEAERERILDLEKEAIALFRERLALEREGEIAAMQQTQARTQAALELQRVQQVRAAGQPDAGGGSLRERARAAFQADARGLEDQQQLVQQQNEERLREQVENNERIRELQLEQLEFEQMQTDDRLERAKLETEADRLRFEGRVERMNLQLQLEQKSLAAEQEAARKRMATRRKLVQSASAFSASMANFTVGLIRNERAAAEAAREAGESEAKAKAESRGESLVSLGGMLIGQSIAQAAQVPGALASFNFVGAGLHAAAATALGIAAAAVIARGRDLKGGGSGSSGGGGGGGTSFGGGGGSGASGGAQGGAGQIPPSPAPAPAPQPGNPAGGAAETGPQPGQGGRTVTINAEFNAVSIDRAAARDIRDKLDELASEEAA